MSIEKFTEDFTRTHGISLGSLLSESSSKDHASRDQFVFCFFVFFCIWTFMNCGAHDEYLSVH